MTIFLGICKLLFVLLWGFSIFCRVTEKDIKIKNKFLRFLVFVGWILAAIGVISAVLSVKIIIM